MTELVRPLLAALVNDDLRLVLAEAIVAGVEPLSPARRERAISKLVSTGVLDDTGDAATFDVAKVRDALRSLAVPRATGVERFLAADGRIDRYPTDHDTRVELLTMIAHRALQPDERVTEPVLTERLEALADDAVLLRRHLIDYGIAQRTPAGTEYWLTPRP